MYTNDRLRSIIWLASSYTVNNNNNNNYLVIQIKGNWVRVNFNSSVLRVNVNGHRIFNQVKVHLYNGTDQ